MGANGSPRGRLWSQCSRKRMRDYYVQNKDNWCMEEKTDACCYKADLTSKSFEHKGCFSEDPMNMSMPVLIGQKIGQSGTFTAQECYELAQLYRESYPVFGLRDYECFAALTDQTYDSKGTSTKCNCDRGALNSVSVFGVVRKEPFNAEDLGCWADTRADRTFSKLLLHDGLMGMTKERCFAIVREENAKRRAVTCRGSNLAPVETCTDLYTFFAVQDKRECWAAEVKPKEPEHYKKHGKSDKCVGGIGGPWANSVYRLKTFVPQDWKIDNL